MTFKQFVSKWGVETPRIVVGSALAEPLNAQFQNLLTEMLDDLRAASKEEVGL